MLNVCDRHAMFVDQKTEACLVPLNEEIDASKGRLELANSTSLLSELFHTRSLTL